MPLALLTINLGSSSLKFAVYHIDDNHHLLHCLAHGRLEALTKQPVFKVQGVSIKSKQEILTKPDNESDIFNWALEFTYQWLLHHFKKYTFCAIGHRVVHGGEEFFEPRVIDDSVLDKLNIYIPLAPLHQPYNIKGIKLFSQYFKYAIQVACFDTSFHHTQPLYAKTYAIPQNISSIPLKRYGFHGLSYQYVAQVLAEYLGEEQAQQKIIVAHLGQGASLCALQNRKSIATSMGFTALDGLPMGTRCGSLDPGIILYLIEQMHMSSAAVTDMLYKHSGLFALSGISSDIPTILQAMPQSISAKQAIEHFIYRTQCEIGSLVAALCGVDGLIFTAGIGENSADIRNRICTSLAWLGIQLDEVANQNNNRIISLPESKVIVGIIPTDEELIIAQQTKELWHKASNKF